MTARVAIVSKLPDDRSKGKPFKFGVRRNVAAFKARTCLRTPGASLRESARGPQGLGYSLTARNRNAFAITETELKLMAAPAIIGLRRIPNTG